MFEEQFNLADMQIGGRWVLRCPNCGRIFLVQYRNDGTYCDCKLPSELQPVYPTVHPKELTMGNGTAIIGTMEFTMRCLSCQKLFVAKADGATAEVLLDAQEQLYSWAGEPCLRGRCPECNSKLGEGFAAHT